jgi:hypothetical protein
MRMLVVSETYQSIGMKGSTAILCAHIVQRRINERYILLWSTMQEWSRSGTDDVKRIL